MNSIGQAIQSSRKININERSQNSRNDNIQAVKFNQVHMIHQKEQMSVSMTKKTPRLGNDILKN